MQRDRSSITSKALTRARSPPLPPRTATTWKKAPPIQSSHSIPKEIKHVNEAQPSIAPSPAKSPALADVAVLVPSFTPHCSASPVSGERLVETSGSSLMLSFTPHRPASPLSGERLVETSGSSRLMSIVRQQSMPQLIQSAHQSHPFVPSGELTRPRLLDKSMAKLQQQIDELHDLMKSLSWRLDTSTNELSLRCLEFQTAATHSCDDLEKRLTTLLSDTKSEASELCHAADKSWRDQIRVLSQPPFPSSSRQEERNDVDPFSNNEQLISKICDEVIARVNADPQICRLAESHQTLQDSFAKLLSVLDKGQPPPVVEDERCRSPKKRYDKDMLNELMIENQKSCKSIQLDLRQIRQRRNQDCTDNQLRFQNLELLVRSMSGDLDHGLESLPITEKEISGLGEIESAVLLEMDRNCVNDSDELNLEYSHCE